VTVTFPQQLGGRAKASKKQSKSQLLKLAKIFENPENPLTTSPVNVSWYRHAYRSRRNNSTFIKTMLRKGELDYGNLSLFQSSLGPNEMTVNDSVNTQ
jgi:hypothetical protein